MRDGFGFVGACCVEHAISNRKFRFTSAGRMKATSGAKYRKLCCSIVVYRKRDSEKEAKQPKNDECAVGSQNISLITRSRQD